MSARILLYDLETAPNLGYVWQKWQTDVIEFHKEWYLLTFSAKWLGQREVICKGLPDYPMWKKDRENDVELVKELWGLINLADIIVAHNGDSFDVKKMNSRFLEHGFNPPEPYKTVDTRKIARKHFAFTSNKLDDLGKKLGLGKKAETGGFKTWRGCMEGDEKCWAKMKKYNKQDVLLLEKVYLKMRPWGEHPNLAAYSGATICGRCGSGKFIKRGKGITVKGTYQIYRCKACGGRIQGPVQNSTSVRPI